MRARFFNVFFAACAIAALCLLYGFFIEPRRLIIRDITIETPLYEGDPIRIALLSDLHIGGAPITPKRVQRIVEKANAQAPDIIFLAGDYINGHEERSAHSEVFNKDIEEGIKSLGGLEAKRGVFAVIGNHDNWYDGPWVAQALRDQNIEVLDNDVSMSGEFCVIGLADFDTAKPSSEPFDLCEPGTLPLVITHSPDAFRYLRTDTLLAVAGHTHGGQINLPFIGRRVTATQAGEPLAYGLKQVGDTPVFITAGIGTSILSARFRAPPEIVVLTLRPAF
jgi:predicted MPP superfamily phosphohydrolase